MKALHILLAVCFGSALSQAQGTLGFRATLTGAMEVPPSSCIFVATGNFTLTGDDLIYGVGKSGTELYPGIATINGPAPVGSTAPVLFTLRPFGVATPDPGAGDPGAVGTSGRLTLTAAQQADLLAGLWYVNWVTADYPEGAIRGQIVPVPEPSTWALVGVGAALLIVRARRMK